MRTGTRIFSVFLSFVLTAQTLPLRTDDWVDLRKRPGNDDIFLMVDTSSSMAPMLGGSLPSVKRFLQDLLVRYVKDGDRVIVMTFDSEAHLRGIVPIVERRRDTELLRDVIDGIDARRVIHYAGTYPNLVETKDGGLTGGGAWTDYCDMWRLSSTAIQKYSDPRHRQLFLLFTDGPPAAPPYSTCNDPSVLSTLSAGLREGRFRMGVVALPTSTTSAEELSGKLSELLQRMPGYDEIRKNALRVITFSGHGHDIDGIRREILELISSRVDLLTPARLSLDGHYTVDLNTQISIINRSRVQRTLSFRGAALSLDSVADPIPVAVTPATITLRPGQRGALTLAAHDFLPVTGDYRGSLAFKFGTGSRFDPAILEFSARKLTWWQAYGARLKWAGATVAALLLVILLWVTQGNQS